MPQAAAAPAIPLFRSVNVFPALKDGDFSSESLTFQADTEDIPSRIEVPIVRLPALRTNPVPHSKRAHTLRTTVGNTPAARVRLGCPSFVDFHVARPVPAGFVVRTLEFRPSAIAPARTPHGWSIPRPCQRSAGWWRSADGSSRCWP